jgi:CRISPR-associated protein Cas5t
MINEVLEVELEGWTATPRLPFVISGNTICMPVPSYSCILGLIGCCLGRLIEPNEVKVGFHYTFDTTATDLETRQRLVLDGTRIKTHAKGTDAHNREFHTAPKLTIWLNRTDWQTHFDQPVGTPSLGRSQDILIIKSVQKIAVESIESAKIGGTMLPFSGRLQTAGQLVQLAEAYRENDEIGKGRIATKSSIFIAVPSGSNSEIRLPNLFKTTDEASKTFYLHEFKS